MAAESFLRNQAVKSVHGFERPRVRGSRWLAGAGPSNLKLCANRGSRNRPLRVHRGVWSSNRRGHPSGCSQRRQYRTAYRLPFDEHAHAVTAKPTGKPEHFADNVLTRARPLSFADQAPNIVRGRSDHSEAGATAMLFKLLDDRLATVRLFMEDHGFEARSFDKTSDLFFQ